MPTEQMFAAGGNVISAGINAASAAIQNKKHRKFTKELYEQQYRDNIRFWNMQNAYNTPFEQVQRLKEAGLNPALIYGGSSGGAAGTAGPIRSPDAKVPEFRTPQWGNVFSSILPAISQIYDLEMKQAQTDKLKADKDVSKQEALLKAAQTITTTAIGKRSQFDLDFEKSLVNVSAEARRQALRKAKVDTHIALQENERKEAMNSSNLLEAANRILNMRIQRAKTAQEVKNLRATKRNINVNTELKILEKNLLEKGISTRDPLFMRILGQMLSQKESSFSPRNNVKKGKKYYRDLWKQFGKVSEY